MHARALLPKDFAAVRGLAVEAAAETEADMGFSDATFAETFASCFNGELTCWVCEDEDALVGFALAAIDGFYFAAGLAASLRVVYVTPAKRGSRAPALLVDSFFRWSDTVGARRKYLGINNSLHPERTARFFERYGARRVGVYLAAG
jgi:GNAT superfamily N-acetyltransferase